MNNISDCNTENQININNLLISNEQDAFYEREDLYNIIKQDYHNKIKHKAYKLLSPPKLNIHSHQSSLLTNNTSITSLSNANTKHKRALSGLPKCPHRNSINTINNNTISCSQTNPKLTNSNSNITTTTSNYNYPLPLLLNRDKTLYSILDKKISSDKLLSLRARFFSGNKLTRGDLTEMTFGKKIPFLKVKTFSDDDQKKIKEVLSNSPKLIINLIENGSVTQEEVIDYFNLNSLHLDWNETLEKKYREIVYNKNKTNSNLLKTTFFLVNIGFHRILRKKFEEKHFISTTSYNQNEINEFGALYEKIKKYTFNVLMKGYRKVETIFHMRDIIIHYKITSIRNEFYEKKVKKFRISRNKEEKCLTAANEGEKNDLKFMKKCIFNIRKNNSFILINKGNKSKEKYVQLVNNNSITKINEKVLDKKDYKNMEWKIKLKQSKNYMKSLIKELRKEGKLPQRSKLKRNKTLNEYEYDYYYNNKSNKHKYNKIRKKINVYNTNDNKVFSWKVFYKEEYNHKLVINYFASLIQSTTKMYMIKKWLKKLDGSIRIIQFNLRKYNDFKRMVLGLYLRSAQELGVFCKEDFIMFKTPLMNIRLFIHVLLRNYQACSFFMFDKDIRTVNLLFNYKLVSKEIEVRKIVHSHKLLIYLDRVLFRLCNK